MRTRKPYIWQFIDEEHEMHNVKMWHLCMFLGGEGFFILAYGSLNPARPAFHTQGTWKPCGVTAQMYDI